MFPPEIVTSLFLVLFVILIIAGFRMPFVHILAGICGIFFGLDVYNNSGSIPLASLIFAFSLLIIVWALVRGD